MGLHLFNIFLKYLILIIASASADVSADMSGDKYTEKGAIIGFLDHVWSLYPSLIAPPPSPNTKA